LDAFVAGVGTGGTLSGCGRYFKGRDANIALVAVEPEASAVLSGDAPGKHGIQGIGAGFVPSVMDTGIVDEVIKVSDRSAVEMARRMAREEGILCGISSGANVHAAVALASRREYSGKRIVTLVCDTGERYLSTTLFEGK
jgi:cysteine synthase A